MQAPLDSHWKAVKRILRYLRETINYSLILNASRDININSYTDPNWNTNLDDRKSTSGYCVYLGENPISWCSKKKSTILRSSTEAEFRSVASATTKVMWIESLLSELHAKTSKRSTIWCDNLRTVSLTANNIVFKD